VHFTDKLDMFDEIIFYNLLSHIADVFQRGVPHAIVRFRHTMVLHVETLSLDLFSRKAMTDTFRIESVFMLFVDTPADVAGVAAVVLYAMSAFEVTYQALPSCFSQASKPLRASTVRPRGRVRLLHSTEP
jgi:hypothetical protein